MDCTRSSQKKKVPPVVDFALPLATGEVMCGCEKEEHQMKTTTQSTMKIRRQNLKRTYAGQILRLTISIRNWPSLGITPDRPQYALRSSTALIATGRDADELKAWARSRYMDVQDCTVGETLGDALARAARG
jgi:hypothetical protein